MERRVLLAIFLSFLVLYVYQALVVKPVPKPVLGPGIEGPAGGATGPRDAVPPAAGAPGALAEATSPKPSGASASQTPAESTAQPLVAETAERDVRVETQDVIAVFTNRGARLKSWRLKRYRDHEGQPQELIENRVLSQPLPF